MKKKIKLFLAVITKIVIRIFYTKKMISCLSEFDLKNEEYLKPKNCTFCKNSNLKKTGYIHIGKDFALFEKDKEKLKKIYLLNLPGFMFSKKFNWFRILILEVVWDEIKNYLRLDYLFCPDCKVYIQNYLNHNFEDHYSFYYRLTRDQNSFGRLDSQAHIDNYQEYIEIFKTYLQDRSILDVGCAEGTLIKLLTEKKITSNCHGIEPSAQMSNYAISKGIKNIKNDVYLQSSYKEKSFDTIVCHHVFEHFIDIDIAIKSFHLHLNDAGILILSVPNVEKEIAKEDSCLYRYLGENFNFVTDHINLFSEQFLKEKFSNSKFKFVKSFKNIRKELLTDLTVIFQKK